MLDWLRRYWTRAVVAAAPPPPPHRIWSEIKREHGLTQINPTRTDVALAILKRDYPGTPLPPRLPRGALARIAEDAGLSRGYMSQIARKAGYHTEGQP